LTFLSFPRSVLTIEREKEEAMSKPLQALAASLSAALVLASGPAAGQAYPSKPVRIICSYSPGGASDVGLRLVAQKMMEAGWPQIVVENRLGAGGSIAAQAAAHATPDGYTLYQGDIGSLAITPAMLKVSYDPVRDFTPITNKFTFPSVLAVPVDRPAQNVAELVALVKEKGDKSIYASQGIGSGGHLLGSLFAKAVGVPITHVPYKGGGQAGPEVAAGRADLIFSSYNSVKAFVSGGKLRLLATTSKTRMPELPSLPTMTEAGYPDVFFDVWFGMVGPANLPQPIVRKVYDDVTRALRAPEVEKRMADLGLYITPSASPEEFGEMIRTAVQHYAVVVKDARAVAN
jgi:tripartite-type tricarboxylate transporter receptor subunit TctC